MKQKWKASEFAAQATYPIMLKTRFVKQGTEQRMANLACLCYPWFHLPRASLLQHVSVLDQTMVEHQFDCPWLHIPWASQVHLENDFAVTIDSSCANLANSPLIQTATGETEVKGLRIRCTGNISNSCWKLNLWIKVKSNSWQTWYVFIALAFIFRGCPCCSMWSSWIKRWLCISFDALGFICRGRPRYIC